MGEAHKLRGILGTYGFEEGSVLAGQAEEALQAGEPVADLSERLAFTPAPYRNTRGR